MTRSQWMLIATGLGLVAISMLYGFYYAVFDEHQTLEKIGVSMATGFAKAAEGDMEAARTFLQTYAVTRVEYLREVHGHSHMAVLGSVLIVIGLLLNKLTFGRVSQGILAFLLITGAVCLPLGAWFDVIIAGDLPKGLSLYGAAALILGMAGFSLGLLTDSSK